MPDASIVGAGIVVVVVGISYLILVWTDIGGVYNVEPNAESCVRIRGCASRFRYSLHRVSLETSSPVRRCCT